MIFKRIRDLEPADVKKYCNKKSSNVEMGYCAGCPFKISEFICLTTLFIVDGSMRTDVTTRNEVKELEQFKEVFKNRLDEEIEV